MTDEEYKKLLIALAAKHIRKGAIGSGEDVDRLHNNMYNLTQLSRQVQDLRDGDSFVRKEQETVVQQPYLRFRLLPPRLDFMLISGQRVKTDVVRPPRGVNSPRTTHHSGFTAATMSA